MGGWQTLQTLMTLKEQWENSQVYMKINKFFTNENARINSFYGVFTIYLSINIYKLNQHAKNVMFLSAGKAIGKDHLP